ncbi:glycosyltransferase involved in cell wall bisynthesis [Jatrophihabitans sp. GAS493]|uniref:glycosyltransferase n=1 Tax=Jatrophihabitans sp. GAS493 TaxID=1907575 RepID=UPI000BB85884|nr:glycosyltransferase [Jatrophihabitans sp. GAS493]SOD71517.1 glycosyltransferase involved in cell wall bisynthesis [Jatrophihabitans sp. GAS493]
MPKVLLDERSLLHTNGVELSLLPLKPETLVRPPAANVSTSVVHMHRTYDLDLIIPALNEAQRIGATVSAISRVLETCGYSARITVVDNGCVDATAAALDQLRIATPVRVISCRTRGKGAAVRAGVLKSTARFVGYCDADLSTPPSSISDALARLDAGVEVVIGSRRCAGASYEVSQPLMRRLGSRAFNRASASLVGGITDTQCGFKLMRGETARAVFAEMQMAGFAFDVELIARLLRRDADVHELPIHWSNDEGSTFNVVSDGVRAFQDVFSVRRLLKKSGDYARS